MLDILESPAFKLSDDQIEDILNKIVPLIAAPEDHEFFWGVLYFKAKESLSSEFALFVKKLLEEASK